jgi:hypothetical protein
MRRLAAISVVVLAIGMGSAVAQPPPPGAPPPPQYEAVPPPPGERYVWEPGHWHWDGVRYFWVRGHYVIRQAGYGHYVPGHWRWAPRLGRYEWIGAHWE